MFQKYLIAACVLCAAPSFAEEEPVRKIQLAILLDTSNSMDGLINQTREQLWRIVNTFATAKKDGKRTRLELALYQYGNSNISAESHYVQRVVPLTTDLDQVSEALFKLKTNGGDEYCGAAIGHALGELEWTADPSDLKLIYIAGNEPFTQGPISFRDSVKRAINRGIVVNTIHAGSEQEGIASGWAEAAKLADGNFLFINSQRAVARVDAPQDAELARLSAALNKTYIGYGRKAKEAQRRQVLQDTNAIGLSAGSGSTRAAAKASPLYRNGDWDLVDAKKEGKPVAADELPEELKGKTDKERDDYVAGKAKERAELQARISELSSERERFVQGELKKKASDGSKTLDDALIESVRVQAAKANFGL